MHINEWKSFASLCFHLQVRDDITGQSVWDNPLQWHVSGVTSNYFLMELNFVLHIVCLAQSRANSFALWLVCIHAVWPTLSPFKLNAGKHIWITLPDESQDFVVPLTASIIWSTGLMFEGPCLLRAFNARCLENTEARTPSPQCQCRRQRGSCFLLCYYICILCYIMSVTCICLVILT